MTDSFASTTDTNANTGIQPVVRPTTENTKDPQFQIGVLEKRVNDKDDFINTLKEENQRIREQLSNYELKLQEERSNISKIDEALNKIGTQRTAQDPQTLDEDALVGKIETRLSQKELERNMDNNFNLVHSELLKVFGSQEKVDEQLKNISSEIKMSMTDMVELARKTPAGFFKLTGITQSSTNGLTFSKGTQQFNTDGNGVRDRAYYARLRKENPKEYWKESTQREFRKLF